MNMTTTLTFASAASPKPVHRVGTCLTGTRAA
jgi:hypothetical protein